MSARGSPIRPTATLLVGAMILLAAGCGSKGSAKDDASKAPAEAGCDPAATEWTLWVANQAVGIDAVWVLHPHDLETPADGKVGKHVLAKIPAGRAPHNLSFTPDGKQAYVANLSVGANKGTVTVIDTRTYGVLATVEAGKTPHATAPTPDGRAVWVANIGSNDVTVIDTASQKVSGGSVAVGAGPTQIAFTPDGAKGFVSAEDDGSVSVVEVAGRKAIASIPTGRGSMGLVVTPDGRLVIETEPLDDRVSVIDVAAGAVINVVTFGGTLREPHGLALAGSTALVTNASTESLAFVDTRSWQRVAGVAVPGRPMIVVVSPDCTRAYLTMRDAPAVAVVDVPGRKLVGTIDMESGSVHGIGALRSAE